jgi:hypothetical protein
VANKRGRFPEITGILLPNHLGIIRRDKFSKKLSVELGNKAIEHIQAQGKGTLILPLPPDLTNGLVVSRFLAKVAVETLALKTTTLPQVPNFLDQLDLIRNHARRGTTPN